VERYVHRTVGLGFAIHDDVMRDEEMGALGEL
jgi:hypothetical protein